MRFTKEQKARKLSTSRQRNACTSILLRFKSVPQWFGFKSRNACINASISQFWIVRRTQLTGLVDFRGDRRLVRLFQAEVIADNDRYRVRVRLIELVLDNLTGCVR